MRAFRDHPSKGIAEKRSAPKLKPLARCRLAAHVAGFKPYAVNHCHINAIGNGMSALNRAPGVMLSHSELSFLRGMPPNRRRIEQHRRTLQCSEPRALREPLIPADQRSEPPRSRIERAKSKVTRGEIKLFIIKRIVGNMHLAVEPAQRSVGIENGRSVVINAGSALLKQ